MFGDLWDSVQSGFSNFLPSDFCLPCFLKGLAEGAVFGLATMALIASAPAWLAVALTVGLAALGAYAIYQLATNWSEMSDEQKSEALGGLAGGLIAGSFGPRLPPTTVPVPGVVWLQTSEGAMPVVVTTPVVTTVPAAVGTAAAPALGTAGAAMMSGGGGGGGGASAEEQKALDDVGPLKDKSPAEIDAKLKAEGFDGPVVGNNGGKIYTKPLENGRTVAVRVCPAEPTGPGTRRPTPRGYADEVPHVHKETVPSSEVQNGNYDPRASGKLRFDDSNGVSNDQRAVHIPINGSP